MKQHKILLSLLAAVLTAAGAFAQVDSEFKPVNWFVGASGGMNIGYDGQPFVARTLSHWGAGTAGDFYIGKYFGRIVGFRVGYHGLGTSNLYTNYDRDRFQYFHADLLFRAGNIFVPYLHAGYARLASGTPAGGVGVMIPIPLGQRVSIVPDFKATALNGAAFTGGAPGLGANLSATLGLRVRLGKMVQRSKPQPPVGPVTPPVNPPVVPDIPDETIPTPPVDTVSHVTTVKEETGKDYVDQIAVAAAYPTDNVVLFDFESSHLREQVVPVLDAWAEYMLSNPGAEILIEGHTCDMGSEEVNDFLSFKRAAAVRDYLTGRGINPMRISVRGHGSKSPAVPNDSSADRALNRRAVITVVK